MADPVTLRDGRPLPVLLDRYADEMAGLLLVGESCPDADFPAIEDRYEAVFDLYDAGERCLVG